MSTDFDVQVHDRKLHYALSSIGASTSTGELQVSWGTFVWPYKTSISNVKCHQISISLSKRIEGL